MLPSPVFDVVKNDQKMHHHGSLAGEESSSSSSNVWINATSHSGSKERCSRSQLNEVVSLRCQTCNVVFRREEDYESHCEDHIPCCFEGCSFEADYKALLNHQMSQHMNLMRRSGGQRKEGCFPNKTSSCSTKDSCIKGNYGDKSSNITLSKSHLMDPIESPEDIEKWREERRRRFPRFKRPSTVKEGDRLEGGGLPGYRRCEKKKTTKMTTKREERMRRRRPTLFQQLMKLQEERERVPSQASLPPSSEKREIEREL